MSRERYGPVIDGLSLVRPGQSPSWVASIVEDKGGKKRVAVGVLSPGLLKKKDALELAMCLVRLCERLGAEGDL